jgi:hypothetical protein
MSLALVAALAVPAVANTMQSYKLLAGQDMWAGDVVLSTENGNVFVEIKLFDDWCMTAAHVDQANGPGGFPTTSTGNPKVGQFHYNLAYNICESYDKFQFPVGGGNLFAVHAVVAKKVGPGSFWATKNISDDQGLKKNGDPVDDGRSDPVNALVKDYAGGSAPTTFYSLGFGGKIVVGFDCRVLNLGGDDLKIWEATNGNYPLEKALVKVSQDGVDFTQIGTAKNLGSGPNRPSSLDAGPLPWFKFVKLVDVSEKAPFEPTADGFDVDGVKALQQCGKFETAWGEGTAFGGGSWAMYIEYGS